MIIDIETEKSSLRDALRSSHTIESIKSTIVNAPFSTLLFPEFDLGTVVLLIVDEKEGYIKREALSSTAASEGAVNASAVPFKDIKIPVNHLQSAHVKALTTMQSVIVSDWYDMFRPVLDQEQARRNQHGAGIATSIVYPYKKDNVSGTIIYSLYIESDKISEDAFNFFDWYTKESAVALSSFY